MIGTEKKLMGKVYSRDFLINFKRDTMAGLLD
jgi:hypothetical protein